MPSVQNALENAQQDIFDEFSHSQDEALSLLSEEARGYWHRDQDIPSHIAEEVQVVQDLIAEEREKYRRQAVELKESTSNFVADQRKEEVRLQLQDLWELSRDPLF